MWLEVVRDYTVLTTQSKATQDAHKSFFFGFSSAVTGLYSNCWAPILLACASLFDSKDWADKDKRDQYFFLLFGVAMNALAGPYENVKCALCLDSFSHILTPEYLDPEHFPHVLVITFWSDLPTEHLSRIYLIGVQFTCEW